MEAYPLSIGAISISQTYLKCRFPHTSTKRSEKTPFSSHGSLRRKINRSRSRDTAKLYSLPQTRGLDLSNKLKPKAGEQRFGHSATGWLRHAHTRACTQTNTYFTILLTASPIKPCAHCILHAHIHCSRNRLRLVLGWVPTKKHHPHQDSASNFDIKCVNKSIKSWTSLFRTFARASWLLSLFIFMLYSVLRVRFYNKYTT